MVQRPTAVVEAPLPTRPAWTVPPSIISKPPPRSTNGVALTQSLWATSSVNKNRFSETEEKPLPSAQGMSIYFSQ